MNSLRLHFIFRFILVSGLLLNFTEAWGITGGRKVQSRDWIASTTVMILGRSEGTNQEVLCSGVIIEEDIVLTAAHCLGADINSMRVVFGESFSNSKYEAEVMATEILPPVLNEGVPLILSDVAVLKIFKKLPPGFQKVKLFKDKIDFKKESSFLIAGFGRSSFTKSDAGVLRIANLKFASENSYYPHMILFSQGISGACPGDSGGPAFIEKNGELLIWGLAVTIYDLEAALEDLPLGHLKDAQCGTSVEYINLSSPKVFSELEKTIGRVREKSKKLLESKKYIYY